MRAMVVGPLQAGRGPRLLCLLVLVLLALYIIFGMQFGMQLGIPQRFGSSVSWRNRVVDGESGELGGGAVIEQVVMSNLRKSNVLLWRFEGRVWEAF